MPATEAFLVLTLWSIFNQFWYNDSVLVDPTPSSDAQILGEQFAQTPLDAIEIQLTRGYEILSKTLKSLIFILIIYGISKSCQDEVPTM